MVFGIGDTVYITGGMLNNIQQINTIGNELGKVKVDELNTIGNEPGKVKVDEISRVKDVSIKAFPCPKVNDKGLTGAWWWADKIAMAVSLWATSESWKAAKEEYKIGKRYYELAKEQWDHFYTYYRPLEDQELSEIWAELPYKPDYPTAIKGHTHLIDPIFAQADKHRMSLMGKYCICPDVAEFTKIGITKSTVQGDSDNFARRYAEKIAQEKNDIRWARRGAAASRGRGLLSASTSFASKAAGFFSDYAQAMGGLASNAMQFSGYVQNRRQTEYNGARERFNSRAEVFDVNQFDNVQDKVRGINFATEATGGLSWASYESPPYMQSGFDPTGVVQTAPRT